MFMKLQAAAIKAVLAAFDRNIKDHDATVTVAAIENHV
jgi:hypothetical protein